MNAITIGSVVDVGAVRIVGIVGGDVWSSLDL